MDINDNQISCTRRQSPIAFSLLYSQVLIQTMFSSFQQKKIFSAVFSPDSVQKQKRDSASGIFRIQLNLPSQTWHKVEVTRRDFSEYHQSSESTGNDEDNVEDCRTRWDELGMQNGGTQKF